jgi:hypothetical protein
MKTLAITMVLLVYFFNFGCNQAVHDPDDFWKFANENN